MNKQKFLFNAYVNSTCMFILSYLVIHFNNQLLTVFVAEEFGLQASWHFSHISTYPELMSAGVSQDARIALTMAVPSISLLLALIGQFAYLAMSMRHAWLSYFLLWWIAHGYNFFFGMFGLSPFFGKYQQHVTSILWLPATAKVVLASASIFILYKIGTNIGRAILAKTGQFPVAAIKDRLQYLSIGILLPWLSGSLLLIIANGGVTSHFGYAFTTLGAIILPALFIGRHPLPDSIEKQHFNNKLNFFVIALTLILGIAYLMATSETL